MSTPKTKLKWLLHQSNLIEGYDDTEFDAQALLAWEYLLEVAPDQLDHHCVKKVQRIITLLQTDLLPHWRGYYRNISGVEVRVGGHKGLPAAQVPKAMDGWLGNLANNTPKQNHITFEHIHPFVDGNGRTGRLLMWWQEHKANQPLTIITRAGRHHYYAWF